MQCRLKLFRSSSIWSSGSEHVGISPTKEVSDWHVQKLLEAAVRAPGAKNLQPWKFVVLRDSRRRINLVKVMRELWEGGARSATLELVPDALFKEVDDGFMSTYANAPVLILVAGDTEQESLEHLGWSMFPAVQNLLLGATALGLGSALTTLAAFRATDVQKIVDLPSSIVPMAVVPIGMAHSASRSIETPSS